MEYVFVVGSYRQDAVLAVLVVCFNIIMNQLFYFSKACGDGEKCQHCTCEAPMKCTSWNGVCKCPRGEIGCAITDKDSLINVRTDRTGPHSGHTIITRVNDQGDVNLPSEGDDSKSYNYNANLQRQSWSKWAQVGRRVICMIDVVDRMIACVRHLWHADQSIVNVQPTNNDFIYDDTINHVIWLRWFLLIHVICIGFNFSYSCDG